MTTNRAHKHSLCQHLSQRKCDDNERLYTLPVDDQPHKTSHFYCVCTIYCSLSKIGYFYQLLFSKIFHFSSFLYWFPAVVIERMLSPYLFNAKLIYSFIEWIQRIQAISKWYYLCQKTILNGSISIPVDFGKYYTSGIIS